LRRAKVERQLLCFAGMNLTSCLLSAVLLLGLLSSRLALADPSVDGLAPAQQQDAAPARVSYAGQIILADFGAVAASALLLTKADAGLASMFPWLLMSPTVHGLHGNPQSGALSFLLHGGLPVAFGFVGYHVDAANCTPNEWFCGLGGLALGGLVGMLSATIIDAAVLARTHAAATATTATSRPSRWSLVPTASIARSGTPNVGLLGTF
jgi:hypothetical protein